MRARPGWGLRPAPSQAAPPPDPIIVIANILAAIDAAELAVEALARLAGQRAIGVNARALTQARLRLDEARLWANEATKGIDLPDRAMLAAHERAGGLRP